MKKVLETRDDIVFFLKMFPLTSLHPDAYEKSKAIVCGESNEKSIELLEAAYDKKPLPKATCETEEIDENIKLATKFGITGTPNIIFENGQLIPGALSSDEIIKIVDSIEK